VFRTQYGYHFLKVIDRRAARGEIRVAHLLVKSPETDNDTLRQQARAKVDTLYARLLSGESFEELVKQFSEDPSTSDKGGVLPFFGTGRMIPDFEEAAFGMARDGDLSQPVQTPYGWHILKRIEYRPVPDFEKSKGDLELKIARDTRANQKTANLITKLKSEYGYSENSPAIEAVLASVVDSLYRRQEWKAPTQWMMKAQPGRWDAQRISSEKTSRTKKPAVNKPTETLTDTIVHRYADRTLRQSELALWLEQEQKNLNGADPSIYVRQVYNTKTEQALLAYEDSRLEAKYPAFRALMKEYREGILLFDLMDQKVWSKAMNDSTGLEDFFKSRAEQYQWKDRSDATIYTCLDEATAKSVRKKAKSGKISPEEIAKSLNSQNPLNVKFVSGKFESGSQPVLDSLPRKKGLQGPFERNKQWVVVQTRELLPAGPKKLAEARGPLTSDYQNELESRWLNELRSTYNVTIDRNIFETLLPAQP
jgi:peptidyl-prolyl cis-trans isomerase SurA